MKNIYNMIEKIMKIGKYRDFIGNFKCDNTHLNISTRNNKANQRGSTPAIRTRP